jgi:hypothetical protein
MSGTVWGGAIISSSDGSAAEIPWSGAVIMKDGMVERVIGASVKPVLNFGTSPDDLVGLLYSENVSMEQGQEILNRYKIKVTYTNHRGETARRTITPLYLHYGATEYHHVDQWLLSVWDHEKKDLRTYAFDDCDFTVPA